MAVKAKPRWQGTLGLVEQTLFNWTKANRQDQLKSAHSKPVSAEQMEIARLRIELARVKRHFDESAWQLLGQCLQRKRCSGRSRWNGRTANASSPTATPKMKRLPGCFGTTSSDYTLPWTTSARCSSRATLADRSGQTSQLVTLVMGVRNPGGGVKPASGFRNRSRV